LHYVKIVTRCTKDSCLAYNAAITPDAMAHNTTEKGSSEGLGVPQNATGAESSPEAMNNTLTPMGPENETVIAK
jgi:hypothetical protein